MPPYEKMLAYSQAMLFYGAFRELRPASSPAPLFMLDNVNFSSAIVADPLPVGELLSVFTVEPGYHTVTGDCELGPVLRALEHARAERWARACGLGEETSAHRVLAGTVAIATAGATGAAHAALTAALVRDRETAGASRREVVFNTPCYCLPEGFARLHGLLPRAVEGAPDQGGLPSLDAIAAAVSRETLACFLTYPANPSLASWSAGDLPALRRLIERCQDLEVLLVADTVFQDVARGPEPVPEIFAVASRPAFLAKIHSPSKDRPLACGYRTGYVLADAALEPWLHRAEGLAKNSNATVGLLWLAFDSLFRKALLAGELRPEDFELLEGSYLCGYGAPSLSAREMYDRVTAAGLFERYAARLESFQRTVTSHLREVSDRLAASPCFTPGPLPDFGNLLTMRVLPPHDAGGEEAFFLDALVATNVASTAGGGFGISREHGVWLRVAVGGAPVASIFDALDRLERHLLARVA